jgi:molybdopterin molybdotransferase
MIGINEASGRVLAQDIAADLDSPAFSHSAMDGIAVRASDLEEAPDGGPISLQITGEIAAGARNQLELKSGQAALIMTGAPLPVGADTVVRVEDTDLDFSKEEIPDRVTVLVPAEKGANIRAQGENYSGGTKILEAGRRLRAQDIGMLAALGKAEVSVYQRPRVGIFASGDEVVEPGKRLEPGQIWNSNSHMLAALVDGCGGKALSLGIIQDEIPAILSALEHLADAPVDLILTSGGVSMGTHDYIRRVLEKHGQLNFWKINMRPGKPLAFGHFQKIPFIGLPGNPVSSFVGARMFVCPALAKLSGQTSHLEPVLLPAVLKTDIYSDGRESYFPARAELVSGETRVSPIGNQSSGNLFALVQANCLIKVAPGVQSLRKDSIVEIWRFN